MINNKNKEIVIIGGANGSGKTTFAYSFLHYNNKYEYLNVDEIAREISPTNLETARLSAGKEFLKA